MKFFSIFSYFWVPVAFSDCVLFAWEILFMFITSVTTSVDDESCITQPVHRFWSTYLTANFHGIHGSYKMGINQCLFEMQNLGTCPLPNCWIQIYILARSSDDIINVKCEKYSSTWFLFLDLKISCTEHVKNGMNY